MSRIGKLPVTIPGGVEIKINNGLVQVKGPKGELREQMNPGMILEVKDGLLRVERPSDEMQWRALHGLTRTLINNMVVGVSEGFTKTLVIEGVGYRAEKKGSGIQLALGFSHPIYFVPPKEIDIEVPTQNKIVISGINKVVVGQVAAKLRSFRPPEPYKGKGVRYENETVRRKAGKTAK
ncbi:MAG: 50S ribosomal protein L6 [Calditrichaeota bacterium]|nr:50S ribosomal protein L6 [Calditrichota bacterium]MCB9087226.1 50S ribosomal protein L6 [Calditrichia bacterium]MCB0288967.1 50S ribosomal protein L6 [Calditrichota bacterium]MCB0295903.1 50S ribosomal protein L6 [Calditrichota bacterium]MCB0302720.1 50S ribosomal protein L6 [Calditrichota bacterium]